MARILVADYGREDLLALGSPLVDTLRTWGYEVIEAAQRLDVLQQARCAQPEAILLYDTLPEMEVLCTALHQCGDTQSIPVLILHETVQNMRFTDMIEVDARYRLGKSPRQFDLHELRRLLSGVQLLGNDA
jgi:DNA-binding response OmpR family regulator